jgi:hypothetical protein
MNWISDLISINAFWTLLLIIHGLLSVALLGALTHQLMAVMRPVKVAKEKSFFEDFRGVVAAKYTTAICLLWVISFVFGGWIYTEYRISIKIPMEQQEYFKTLGVFELKEHLVVFGLAMLPIYNFAWKHYQQADLANLRKYTTLFLTFVCWYAFLIGHIVNNARGYGA